MRSAYLLIGILAFVGCTSRSASTEGQDSFPVTSKEKEKALIDLASKYYSEDDYEKSRLIYDALSQAYPDSGVFFYRKAYSESQLENFAQAQEDYLTAAKLKHRAAEAYYASGVIQLTLGDSLSQEQNDSIQLYFFRKSLESQPDIETESRAKEFIEAIVKNKPKSS